MEGPPKHETSIEEYESLLSVRLADISREEIKRPGTYVFAVSPEFRIYISKTSHMFIENHYGVNQNTALTRGYLRIHADGTPEVHLYGDIHHPHPSFDGTNREFHLFKQGVMNKLENLSK